jgi:predicted metal-binding membrane protein
MLVSTTPALGGVLFIFAGVYQLTPLKNACLSKCRAPAQFLAARRRNGPFLLGMEHGAYCVGCCWVLMALLFAVGVMNLLWVAGIAAFVLMEKLLPAGLLIARLGAAVMLGAGVIVLVAPTIHA